MRRITIQSGHEPYQHSPRGIECPATDLADDWPVALRDDDLPIRQHRNLLVHAPKHMHDALTEDYRDMIHVDTAAEVERRREALPRASGGSSAGRWPTTSRKPGRGYSPSPASTRPNGSQPERPTPSNV